MDRGATPASLPRSRELVGILRQSTTYLERAGVPSPRLEAELLLSHSLGVSRLDLYLQFERPLSPDELAPLRELLRGRARGRPLAYLVGEKEFYGLTFQVSEAVLVPRPETELLVRLAIAAASRLDPQAKALDLGTGSGCVAIALAVATPGLEVDAVDLEAGALAVARGNVARHRLQDRVTLHHGSWSRPVLGGSGYQLVLSNPPYVSTSEWRALEASVRDFEPRSALDAGEDGLAAYRELLPEVARVAAPGAQVLLECDPRRISEVADLCRAVWAGCELDRHRDLSQRERVLEVSLG